MSVLFAKRCKPKQVFDFTKIEENYIEFKNMIEEMLKKSTPKRVEKVISSLGKNSEFRDYAKSFPGMKKEGLYLMFLQDHLNLTAAMMEINFKSLENEKTKPLIKKGNKIAIRKGFEDLARLYFSLKSNKSRIQFTHFPS